jgi:hypothetical protein
MDPSDSNTPQVDSTASAPVVAEPVAQVPPPEPEATTPSDLSTPTSAPSESATPTPGADQSADLPAPTAIEEPAKAAIEAPASPVEIPANPAVSPAQTPVQSTVPQSAAVPQLFITSYFNSLRQKGNAARSMRKQKKMDHIVEIVGKHGPMTRGELLLIVHISSAQMGRYLEQLIREGRLRYVGHKEHGKYENV